MEWRRWIVGVYWKKMPSLSELQSAQRSANLFQEILTLIVMRFYSVPVFWIKVQRQRNWNHPIQCIRNSRLPKINVQLVVRMTFSPRVAHFRICAQFWICAALEIFIQREIKKNTFYIISNFNPFVRLHVHFQSLLTVEGPAAIVGVTFDQLRRPLHDMSKF